MSRTVVLSIVSILAFIPIADGADASILWARKVQPVFDLHCVKCHGPMEQKSGLELDSPDGVLKGGDEGAVVVPGRPDESRLYRYLAPDADPHMPPKKQLTEPERETVRDWIATLGATASGDRPESAASRSFGSVTEAIDTCLAEDWRRNGVSPVAGVDDSVWCRRVYLDLAGRMPTAGEVAAFLEAPSGPHRAELVGRLLASEEYPVRMRELWDVFLMGRPKREAHEDRRRKNGWWEYLERAFRSNQPWDQTVRDLLIARPDRPEARGASWFLYERRNDHQAIAEAVGPLVYGTRIDCAQCHNHPLARELLQAHYWGLVAAFNRSKNVDGGADVAESAVGGFVNFTNLKKESQPARIVLIDGRVVDDEPRPVSDATQEDREDLYLDPAAKVRVPRFSRRAAFAEAVMAGNDRIARAFVNRMWAVLVGRGLVHPVDQMTARNPANHPELLAWLATDFAANGYNVRRLVEGIALSRLYALGWGGNEGPDSTAAVCMIERSLSAEQIARSWRVAAGLTPDDETLRRAVVGALPEVLPREYQPTFQQAQFLTFSPALAGLLNPAPGNSAERLLAMADGRAQVRDAFRFVLGRTPDAEELERVDAFLKAYSGRESEGMRDMLWALMTSAEFLAMP